MTKLSLTPILVNSLLSQIHLNVTQDLEKSLKLKYRNNSKKMFAGRYMFRASFPPWFPSRYYPTSSPRISPSSWNKKISFPSSTLTLVVRSSRWSSKELRRLGEGKEGGKNTFDSRRETKDRRIKRRQGCLAGKRWAEKLKGWQVAGKKGRTWAGAKHRRNWERAVLPRRENKRRRLVVSQLIRSAKTGSCRGETARERNSMLSLLCVFVFLSAFYFTRSGYIVAGPRNLHSRKRSNSGSGSRVPSRHILDNRSRSHWTRNYVVV